MNNIVFTGGGTAGHITPNLALIAKLKFLDWNIHYIGSEKGIEKELTLQENIPFHAISSGKLRRYWDIQNFFDPFRVIKGIWDAYFILRKIRPQVVFSKGGFVTVPVVFASYMLRIPVIIHESDITPGLANRIVMPLASNICVSFPETLKHIRNRNVSYTGLPIRSQLFEGEKDVALKLSGFHQKRPTLLVIGGSLGSQLMNRMVRSSLQVLLSEFQIIHICGKGNLDDHLVGTKGYYQLEYVAEELPHFLALADIVLSRAGATSIFEFLALQKPMLLVPISLQASRGDQIDNARSFCHAGFADMLLEEEITKDVLIARLHDLYEKRDVIIEHMRIVQKNTSVDKIIAMIEKYKGN